MLSISYFDAVTSFSCHCGGNNSYLQYCSDVFRSCKTCQKTLLPVVQLVLLAMTVSFYCLFVFSFTMSFELDSLIT